MKKVTKTLVFLMLVMAVFCSCKKEDNADGNGRINGHTYIDLGLPSGTLWAVCNVGATSPEDYGDYFAWGETETKETYVWSTYKYCNGSNDWNNLTKYCNKSSYGDNGFTDDLNVLLPEDNAATVRWGGDWRIPTKEEWDELLNNTTNICTIQNGVFGRLFFATNGASLFLPAAGYRSDDLEYAGEYGCYWSTLLDTEFPNDAYYLDLDSESYGMFSCRRFFGQSVRAVHSAPQN